MGEVVALLQAEPFLVPAYFLVCVGIFLWHRRTGRQDFSWRTFFFVVAAAGFLVVTITPSRSRGTQSYCAVQWADFVPGHAFLSASTPRLLNVLIAIPMAVFAVAGRRGSLRWARLVSVCGLPLTVEAIQWAWPWLGRSCSTMDLGDNLTGVLIGISIGALTSVMSAAQHSKAQRRIRTQENDSLAANTNP
ncbi:MAG: VanZ family protein [Angustibacter sp.]